MAYRKPTKLILKSFQSPGDVVMLTGAIRDLHIAHPGRFITDVRTSTSEIWENNPYLTPLDEHQCDVTTIPCHYPLIHRSNQAPYHFIHGYRRFLEDRLRVRIPATVFRGDLHLTEEEKTRATLVDEAYGRDTRYWVLVAGGKRDFTVKWWSRPRFEEVIDRLREKVLFAQVGAAEHEHPPIEGALDLRGKTSIRELIRLIHRADGVLCPVTLAMHIAAAVGGGPGRPERIPCVVVAGGREPSHWEAYPHHRFLHTVGALPCCSHGGCWKSRVVPLGDGDEKDHEANLCVDVVNGLSRCMDMITVEEVVRAILLYYQGGVLPQSTPA